MSFGERSRQASQEAPGTNPPSTGKSARLRADEHEAVAQKLQTEAPTVMRILQGLGSESYKDCKAYLHGLAIVNATCLQGTQAMVSGGDSNSISQGRRALDQDGKTCALRNRLEMEQLDAITEKIHRARPYFCWVAIWRSRSRTSSNIG